MIMRIFAINNMAAKIKNTFGKNLSLFIMAGAIFTSGCDSHQKELERRWNSEIAKGTKPYVFEVEEQRNEYLDINDIPGYDLVRIGNGKPVYAEIGETSEEDLRRK